MRMRPLLTAMSLAVTALTVLVGLGPTASNAASHREAPLIALDQTADISDFFMFRSYEQGKDDRIVLIMNAIPGQEPSSGPNYWNFDPNVRYEFSIDNNRNGKANDVEFEIQFTTEIRGINKDLKLPLSYVALPPITALDGPGSEGLGLRQKYSIWMTTEGRRERIAENLIAVPSNVGPRTMPDYAALARQGIYELDNGMRVFAGQRQDPFYIDLGGVFDTLNLRRSPLPLLTAAEDADDTQNAFGVDQLSGFNVSSIVLEVPAHFLTKDGKGVSDTEQPVLGAYASTSRQTITTRRGDGSVKGRGDWVQVQRLANPLVNEAIIGTVDKDLWNAREPEREFRFVDYYLNPRLALALQTVFNVPAATQNRTDLRDLLLKYSPSDSRLSELLRLDISVAPTPLAQQRRMGPLAATPDPTAWPNGRRPKDDVTDIAVRVVGGPNYINARAGDGINVDLDAPLPAAFPFLANPSDGLTRTSMNP